MYDGIRLNPFRLLNCLSSLQMGIMETDSVPHKNQSSPTKGRKLSAVLVKQKAITDESDRREENEKSFDGFNSETTVQNINKDNEIPGESEKEIENTKEINTDSRKTSLSYDESPDSPDLELHSRTSSLGRFANSMWNVVEWGSSFDG